ncbi:type II secretion system protein [Photobacterium aphoticum]|uniref:MSHA biogenesis protein MshA n=1 Tax=Photobacterium aphoticum TaxID=754436 RepID=A0A0J1GTH3_9GAMM|nr:type II secretion system protein [Photobacterium aphoticum]KLV02724.1 MSHA biogenesis protein MshA [Photobacterium aphoticum]PSU54739.1 type II secretion system protein [Photobacterium aphoticum]GHA54555.1 MSHA pilin protein MshA [Photobacterium aphoticum]
MKRQGGFTLIEMVVVIVILGILAVTAAPRFLNLQDDARASALQGLKGAIDGAAAITYGKAAVQGKESSDDATVEGVKTVYGYPAATSAALSAAVVGLSDWQFVKETDTSITYTYKGNKYDSAAAATCIVTYTQATGVSAVSAAHTTVDLGAGCNISTN